ncbi:hypothetical protein [Pseudoduganella violaceinigra]|uniref:hypothetical protein n=1 Tax=Pseudoduganella violaceinigra TaxID=246602 RepID=UPI0004206895|nr:hypothetical protein [Pseudoduganella violaceinigra]
MWNVVILTLVMSLAGAYAALAERNAASGQQLLDGASAESMANYRSAVVAYFRANDLRATSVSLPTLRSSGALRDWPLLEGPQATPWGNYRDAGGTIYVYATQLPRHDLTRQIVQLARNSVLAGSYRRGAPNLQSPVYGDTGIPLAALASLALPDGVPVWLAVAP